MPDETPGSLLKVKPVLSSLIKLLYGVTFLKVYYYLYAGLAVLSEKVQSTLRIKQRFSKGPGDPCSAKSELLSTV